MMNYKQDTNRIGRDNVCVCVYSFNHIKEDNEFFKTQPQRTLVHVRLNVCRENRWNSGTRKAKFFFMLQIARFKQIARLKNLFT